MQVSCHRSVVLVVLAVLVSVPMATGIAVQGGTAAASDTDPAVKFAYVSQETGNVTMVTTANDRIDAGVTADVVGAAADIDGDYYAEVPYVTSNGDLYVVERTGETQKLASSAASSTTKVAVGDLDEDGTNAVYYVNSSSGTVWSATADGSRHEVGSGLKAKGVAGVANITSDAGPELAYVGSSSGYLRYYNGTTDVKLSNAQPAEGGAVGAPRVFGADGGAAIPYVTGSANIKLAYANGTTTKLAGPSSVKKAAVAAVNWTGDATPEVLYVSSNSPKPVKYVTLSGETGTAATTNPSPGIGVARVTDTDEPLAFSNFTVENASNSLRVSFDSTEDLQSASVNLSGPDGTTLSLSDFDETSSGGDYTYVANYTPTADGTYDGTLDSGTAVDGDTANPDLTDSASVDRPFDVTDLNATAAPGQDLNISFEATDALDSLALTVSGAENATLDLSDFSTNDSSAPYVYTGTYDGSSDGNYTVTFDSASSPQGTDDGDLTDTVRIDQTFAVSNFTMVSDNGTLRLSFDSTDDLSGADVDVSGPDGTTLSLSDFDEVSEYRYVANYTPNADGNYTATLDSAASPPDQTVNPDYTADATVDVRFNVTDLNATAAPGQDLNISFNATDPVSSVTVDVSGAENATLDASNFSTTDSSAPYAYEGTYDGDSDGNYTVNLTTATGENGVTDDADLTDTASIDQVFRTWNFTLANASGDLRVAFSADERLSATTVDITGPSNRTLGLDDFAENTTDDGYRYVATYTPTADGTYNGTLESATSWDDQVTTPGYTDDATIERPFTVWNLTLAPQNGNLTVGFDADADVTSASLALSGAENATLDFSEFAEIGSDPYRYETTYDAGTDGNYTVSLTSASSPKGTFDGTLTANATRDVTDPIVVNATLADATDDDGAVNETDSVSVRANVSGDVDTVTADLSAFGAGTVTLTEDNGTYTATAAVDASSVTENRTATVTAFDGQGNTASADTNALLLDTVAPTVDAGDAVNADVDESVSFAPDTAADIGSGITDYTWDLVTATADSRTTTYAYESPDTYVVRLAVTDDAGNVATDSFTVDVDDTTTDTTSTTTTTDTATQTTTTTTTAETTDTTSTTTTETTMTTTTASTTTETTTTTTHTTTTTTTRDTTTAETNSSATTTETPTDDPTTTDTSTTRAAGRTPEKKVAVPGFGVFAALLAAFAVALLARRE